MRKRKLFLMLVSFTIIYLLYFFLVKNTQCYLTSRFTVCDPRDLFLKAYYFSIVYLINVFIICLIIFKNKKSYYPHVCIFITLLNFILFYDYLNLSTGQMGRLDIDFKLSILLVVIEPLILGFIFKKIKVKKKRA